MIRYQSHIHLCRIFPLWKKRLNTRLSFDSLDPCSLRKRKGPIYEEVKIYVKQQGYDHGGAFADTVCADISYSDKVQQSFRLLLFHLLRYCRAFKHKGYKQKNEFGL